MAKTFIAALAVGLMAATAAQAQIGDGGMRRGGMGGHRGGDRRGRRPEGEGAERHDGPVRPDTPLNKVMITGVIQAVDAAHGRLTIAYDAVDALNWPAGTNAFPVARTALLQGASVGEKVRFHIESQEITALRPYPPPRPRDPG